MKLFRPAWDSKNWKRAVKAVRNIKYEVELLRIAKEARCWQACEAARRRIEQNLLADLTENDKEDSDVRGPRVEKRIDPALLVEIAQYGTDSALYMAVAKRVTDPVLLARMATEAWYFHAALTAVEKLTDPALLADIAENSRYNHIRAIAVKSVTDPARLTDIVKNDKDSGVRIAASRQLLNYDPEEEMLTYIIRMSGDELKNSGDEWVESREWIRRSAAETLLACYRRYRESKGEAIRLYEGEYKGGYSDYNDGFLNAEPGDIDYEDYDDHHRDTRYTIHFNPEET